MPTDVIMPQMGESIAEGTIVRWIKKVGDQVERDEPLFEISTDKVDAEIPSPAAGVLTEIRASEGQTVPVNSVVAIIGGAETKAALPAAAPAPAEQKAGPPTSAPKAPEKPREAEAQKPAPPPPVAAAPPPTSAAASPPQSAAAPPPAGPPEGEKDDLRRQKSSPLVRRIAREHDVDISRIPGTGIGGRVTKHDILSYLDSGQPAAAPAAAPEARGPAPAEAPAVRPGERVQVVPMSVMRRRIAEHMVQSRRTSAHVHSVFEVDFSRVAQIRSSRKAEYERLGAKLTYMSFITRASVDALRAVPVVNASIDGDNIVYRQDVNIGVAVALDWGLIVPVIKNADEKNLLGLSRAIADLANRARAKQLKPDEVQGGTFTVTNPGVFGALFGMPIINQPQVAILGVGAVEKRVVVRDDDSIAVRPMAYLSLGYDHRLIDGAVADQFMSHLKQTLETFDPAAA
jgi:2-oxoglutarate dehydrogenase E2 component (dihydrolipoamide succinyltransferase)